MDIGIHGVFEVRAKAYSNPIECGEYSFLSHVQNFEFLDRYGKSLGKLTLYLDNTGVAIPVGDLSGLIHEN